ncbi:hypothetical protein F7725_012384, partial [Dissostichus mawsoni]
MQGKAEENSPAKAEKSKDELWETYVSLQEELNRAERQQNLEELKTAQQEELFKKDEQSQENQTRLDEIDEEMRVKRDRVLEEQDCDWTGLDFERKRLKNNDREDSKALRKLYDLKERDKLVERETAVALRQSERLKESLQRSKATCMRILRESHDLDVKKIQLELKIEQNNGLKHLLLERKIQTQTETQERLELRLWVVQAVLQKDQTALKNIKWLPLGTNTKPTKKASEDKGSDSLMQSLTTLCISDNDPVRRDVVKQNSVSTGTDDELLRLS